MPDRSLLARPLKLSGLGLANRAVLIVLFESLLRRAELLALFPMLRLQGCEASFNFSQRQRGRRLRFVGREVLVPFFDSLGFAGMQAFNLG